MSKAVKPVWHRSIRIIKGDDGDGYPSCPDCGSWLSKFDATTGVNKINYQLKECPKCKTKIDWEDKNV